MDKGSDFSSISPSTATETSRQQQLVGAGMVVISTAAIAIVPTLAKLAYDGGTNTMTVIVGRSIFSALACFIVVAALRRSLNIPRRSLCLSLGLGVLYAVHLYCLLAAVLYLPVNMVVLIYFLHPLMIGLAAIATGRQTVSVVRLGARVGAIAGLCLAVGFSTDNLNQIGMWLAFAAAVIAAIVIVLSTIAMKDSDSLVVVTYMMIGAAVVLVIVSAARGGMVLPANSIGWIGFAGVAFAYTLGTLTFFGAIPLLGALRAAMITNLEPVLGVLFAVAILDERISLLQGVGIVLVIASIFAFERARG